MWLFSGPLELILCQKIIRNFLTANEGKQINFNLFCDKVLTGDILTGLKEKKYDIGFCSKFDDEPLIEFIGCQTGPGGYCSARPSSCGEIRDPSGGNPSLQTDHFKKRSGLRQIIDQLFKSIGQYPDVAFEIDEDQVAAGFVANDFGICIAPDIPILHSLDLKILPLVSPSWQRNFYMAMLKDVYHPPVVEAFKKFVIEKTSKRFSIKQIKSFRRPSKGDLLTPKDSCPIPVLFLYGLLDSYPLIM